MVGKRMAQRGKRDHGKRSERTQATRTAKLAQ
jgi:hypothetical protein